MLILRSIIDIWLPDFKFGPGKCAFDLSKTPWYWETVTWNLVHDWNEDFVIRHLIMPNHVECCTKPILDWIAKNMPEIPINIMDQYYSDNYVILPRVNIKSATATLHGLLQKKKY